MFSEDEQKQVTYPSPRGMEAAWRILVSAGISPVGRPDVDEWIARHGGAIDRDLATAAHEWIARGHREWPVSLVTERRATAAYAKIYAPVWSDLGVMRGQLRSTRREYLHDGIMRKINAIRGKSGGE